MFTGIVSGLARVAEMTRREADARLVLDSMPEAAASGLAPGMSVAVDGCCLTVVEPLDRGAAFDLSLETLKRTTLGDLTQGCSVNVEAAMRFGDPVGGHEVSGHVDGKGALAARRDSGNGAVLTFEMPEGLKAYVFDKGYVALNGASLTVTDLDRAAGRFDVHVIPETLRLTTFGALEPGAPVNVEVDRRTQAVVDTVRGLVSDAGGVEAFLKQL